MSDRRFRLITRADFDGVVCGALLKEIDMIDDVLFVHPKDMQDGNVAVDGRDISANLPYVEGIHLCFDHHWSEIERVGARDNLIIDPEAPSAARVIYGHYGGKARFPDISEQLMAEVDRADSAQYEETDILMPEGWVLLNFIMDGRTGLGQYKEFTISNEHLMVDMMTYCRHHAVEEILALPDVEERIHIYNYQGEFMELQLDRCSKVLGNVVVSDLRAEDPVYSGNRFMIYALYPQCNVSVHLRRRPEDGMTEIAVGKSIMNRTSKANVGSLMLEYGGGGHRATGTCRLPPEKADEALSQIVARLKD